MSGADADSTSARSRWVPAMNFGYFSSGRSRRGDAEQAGQVQRAGQRVDLGVGDLQLAHQQVEDVRVDGLLDLQAHRRPEAAPHELLLQGLEQVLGVVLLDLQVLVAGDPEHVVLQHLHAREQLLQVRGDDVLQRDVAAAGRPPGSGTAAAAPSPGRSARWPLTGLRTTTARFRDRPEMYGKGCAGSTASGVSTGKIWCRKRVNRRACSFSVSSLQRTRWMPSSASAGATSSLVAGGVPGHELAGAGPDHLQHLAGLEAGGGAGGDAGGDAALQAGHPDHEELVQVAGEDRQEVRPLQQRRGRVLGQFQHALVEREPAALPVEEAALRQLGAVVASVVLVRVEVGVEVGFQVGDRVRGHGVRAVRGDGADGRLRVLDRAWSVGCWLMTPFFRAEGDRRVGAGKERGRPGKPGVTAGGRGGHVAPGAPVAAGGWQQRAASREGRKGV